MTPTPLVFGLLLREESDDERIWDKGRWEH
jgi:hypothetical protein